MQHTEAHAGLGAAFRVQACRACQQGDLRTEERLLFLLALTSQAGSVSPRQLAFSITSGIVIPSGLACISTCIMNAVYKCLSLSQILEALMAHTDMHNRGKAMPCIMEVEGTDMPSLKQRGDWPDLIKDCLCAALLERLRKAKQLLPVSALRCSRFDCLVQALCMLSLATPALPAL